MSITWWSASVVVPCGRLVRQTLFQTVGGSGTYTVRRDKERVVLRVGSCSEKIMSPTPVPEGCSVDAQAFLCSSFVSSCNHRFSSVSCTKLFWSVDRELSTVDDVREMPYLPIDAQVDPVGVSVLSNKSRCTLPRSWNL